MTSKFRVTVYTTRYLSNGGSEHREDIVPGDFDSRAEAERYVEDVAEVTEYERITAHVQEVRS